jgi:CYTH domain-containing protein
MAALELELELSYLAASIPPGLDNCESKQLADVYFPANADHAKLRIRQKGDQYEFTKKTQADPNDAGAQHEENVRLTADEFAALAQGDGRNLAKTRYFLPYQGRIAEVDVFSGPLQGLVIIEFEFDTPEEKNAFVKPDFCLADVTQEDFIAGGVLAGKSYQDIASELARFGYEAL